MLYCRPSRLYCIGCGIEMILSENGAVNAATMIMLINASVESVGFGMRDRCCFSIAFDLLFVFVDVVVVAPLFASRWAVGLPAPGVSYGFAVVAGTIA